MKRLISGLALSLLFSVLFCISGSFAQTRIKTIVIDAGHGGVFSGTLGKYTKEKDMTLKIALLLGKTIEANIKDVKVIYVRTTDMNFSDSNPKDLKYRIDMANKAKADLLISIHCNSMPASSRNRSSVKGVETFVAGSERLNEQDAALKQYSALEAEYQLEETKSKNPSNDPANDIMYSLIKGALRDQSIRLATLIQDEYIATGRVNRGVQELSLAVLRTATMPAVLTEVGFLSNPEEEDYINSESGQNEIVGCLLRAIQAYKKQAELQ